MYGRSYAPYKQQKSPTVITYNDGAVEIVHNQSVLLIVPLLNEEKYACDIQASIMLSLRVVMRREPMNPDYVTVVITANRYMAVLMVYTEMGELEGYEPCVEGELVESKFTAIDKARSWARQLGVEYKATLPN